MVLAGRVAPVMRRSKIPAACASNAIVLINPGLADVTMSLLKVKNLTTRFYTAAGIVHAVNGVSFTLDEGESLALVGESGSGKTVTALSIMGLVPSPPGVIENGQVQFKEYPNLLQLSDRDLRHLRGKEIAMIFQDPMTSLNPVLTIGRQLAESLRLHLKYDDQEARYRSLELLELVGIPDGEARLDDYPHQFSGGQRQRVMIAMALSCHPALLIADEPTTALDVTIQAQIVNLMKQLKAQLGMTIIWITHDLAVVAGLVDKVAVMYAGFIVEEAQVNDLYVRPSHPYTLGLLQSLPKIDIRERVRLQPIEGTPPDMLVKPAGCPFAPRCPYVAEICREENPELVSVGAYHKAACWQWDQVRNESLEQALT